MPYSTSLRACSFVSARCIGPTSRHFDAVGGVAVLVGDLVPRLPVRAERVEALPCGRGDRQQPDAVRAGRDRAGRRDGRRDRDLEVRFAVRLQLQARVLQREPVGLHRDGLAAEQRHDRVERLVHPRPLPIGRDAEHVRVGRQLARPAAEHRAAAREVVEQHEAVGEHQRVVVRQRVHAGAEPDVLRAFRRRRDEHLRRRDDLVAAGVVLADPRLVEAEPVEVLDQLQVAFERERRVLPVGWNGAMKIPKRIAAFDPNLTTRSSCSGKASRDPAVERGAALEAA